MQHRFRRFRVASPRAPRQRAAAFAALAFGRSRSIATPGNARLLTGVLALPTIQESPRQGGLGIASRYGQRSLETASGEAPIPTHISPIAHRAHWSELNPITP